LPSAVAGCDSAPVRRARAFRRWTSGLLGLLVVPALALAADLRVVAVTPGRSAKVMIEGRPPIAIAVGSTVEGVTVVRADATGTEVRVGGKTLVLPLQAPPGETAPAPRAAADPEPTAGPRAVARAASRARTVTLFADARGHFLTPGTINDEPVHFLVDTGATSVALSRADAERIGLDYRQGKATYSSTANGVVRGWSVNLKAVRIGGVTIRRVDATVIEARMPFVLLGMTFLNRFDMHREGSKLVLEQRGR
jgi:aspartyl protease family protein